MEKFKNYEKLIRVLGETTTILLYYLFATSNFRTTTERPFTIITNNQLRKTLNRTISDTALNKHFNKLIKLNLITRKVSGADIVNGKYVKNRKITLNFNSELELIEIINNHIDNNILNGEKIEVPTFKETNFNLVNNIINKVLDKVNTGRALTIEQVYNRVIKQLDKVMETQCEFVKIIGVKITKDQIFTILNERTDFERHYVTDKNIIKYKLNKKLQYRTPFYIKK